MNNYKKLGKNIALLTIGNFASKVLSFLLVPLYTSILSTDEYGTADIITTSVNLILPIFTCLIYESVLRFALDRGEDLKQVFSIGFWITLFGSIIVIILSQFLTFSSAFSDYILYFVLYYISLAFYNLILQYVKGKEEIHTYAISGVINTFVYILCNIVFIALFRFGVYGYLISFVLGHLLSTLYAIIVSKTYRDLILWTKIKRDKLKEMLRYALPMIPNSISWWISNSSDKYVILFYWGTSINGIYSVSYKIPSILTIIVGIFISAWQISAVEDFGTEESRQFYSSIYKKYELLLFVGGGFLILITKILALFLFSNEFYIAWMYTPVLILASIFNSLASFLGSIYTSAKKTSMLFYSTLLASVINIILNFILIPIFSAMGAAIATLISYFLVWIVRVIDSRKIIKLKVNYFITTVGILFLLLEVVFMITIGGIINIPSCMCVLAIILLYRKEIFDSLIFIKNRLLNIFYR